MVFQQFNVFKNMTVIQNVMDPLVVVQRKSKDEAREIALQELERVGLSAKRDSYPSQLSGGQLQRTGIARALAVRPDVMLFDEPTSSLDPELVGEVLKVIKDVTSSGITSLLVTHEMQFAKNISNRIVFMDHGVIAAEGSPAEIFDHASSPRLAQFLTSEHRAPIEKGALKCLTIRSTLPRRFGLASAGGLAHRPCHRRRQPCPDLRHLRPDDQDRDGGGIQAAVVGRDRRRAAGIRARRPQGDQRQAAPVQVRDGRRRGHRAGDRPRHREVRHGDRRLLQGARAREAVPHSGQPHGGQPDEDLFAARTAPSPE